MIRCSRCCVYLVTIALSLTVWTGDCAAWPQGQGLQEHSRRTRQSCGSGSFQCASGKCIDNALTCDGADNCSDGSDEKASICQKIHCSPFAFKCSYGACVDGSAECDGKRDCIDNSDESCSSSSETGKCKRGEFSCNSGECISSEGMCDGNKNCKDGSDETATTCSTFSCNPLAFRCDYGACIDADKECDGQVQCSDGSDESPARCGSLPGSCTLPAKPSHGGYKVNNCQGCQDVPGTSVGANTGLSLFCDKGYTYNGSYPLSSCYGGQWIPNLSTCVTAKCKPLSSSSLDIECAVGPRRVPCDLPMDVGTQAELSCKTAYRLAAEYGYSSIRCQSNGEWDNPLFKCNPVCGKVIAKGTPQVSHGHLAKVGEFPWHVAIYKQQEHICGGTLIGPKFVLSAAHCFWDANIPGINDKKLYSLAMGKFYRSYAVNEEEKQLRDVADIIIPEKYHDRTRNYENDIALLVVKVEVKLTWAVQPVCIDWDNNKEREQLAPNQFGSVAGWGYTETDKPSEELQTAKLPYVDYHKCWAGVDPAFQPFITNDKFCAGNKNGTSVCRGDSGGGLVFEYRDLNVWYLRGVVSIGATPTKGERCAKYKYTAFTMVSYHITWLTSVMEKYGS